MLSLPAIIFETVDDVDNADGAVPAVAADVAAVADVGVGFDCKVSTADFGFSPKP